MDGAIAEYRETIRLQPQLSRAHNNLATALREKGALAEAIAEYREAVRLESGNAVAHYNLGIALEKRGDRHAALEQFRIAANLQPNDPDFAAGVERLSGQPMR